MRWMNRMNCCGGIIIIIRFIGIKLNLICGNCHRRRPYLLLYFDSISFAIF